MSRKHFEEYYNELYSNYDEMIKLLKELENECINNMVAPETIENYKKTLEPIKNAFLNVQYIKYLLDKPNKKEK